MATKDALWAKIEAERKRFLAIDKELEELNMALDKTSTLLHSSAMRRRATAVLKEALEIRQELLEQKRGQVDTIQDVARHLEEAGFFEDDQPDKETAALEEALAAFQRLNDLSEDLLKKQRKATTRLNELLDQLRPKA